MKIFFVTKIQKKIVSKYTSNGFITIFISFFFQGSYDTFSDTCIIIVVEPEKQKYNQINNNTSQTSVGENFNNSLVAN